MNYDKNNKSIHLNDQTVKKDEVYSYNEKRWEALVRANALFTRPHLDLDQKTALHRLDPSGRIKEVCGKKVLCLASGGGQQSAAFGILGADVTVYDISNAQLERDHEAAKHYGYSVKTIQGDMRDLKGLEENSFDIVWHPYSINFVPDAKIVFQQVAKVIKPGGIYHFMCANPFVWGMTENEWNGEGYTMKIPYYEETSFTYADQEWVFEEDTSDEIIDGPREYRHTLSSIINGLNKLQFMIDAVEEITSDAVDIHAKPGTWDHFTAIAPPWIKFWTTGGQHGPNTK